MTFDETPEMETDYEFFKGISMPDKYYLCDFHKTKYKDGSDGYRVLLQATGQKGIVTDLLFINDEEWRIIHTSVPIDAELQWKIITAILEHNEKK
jgi:hypothetical protein